MKIASGYLVCGLLALACSPEKHVTVDRFPGNPVMRANTAFELSEDLRSPRFAALKEKYRTDTIFGDTHGEFQRQLLLRNWIRSVIQISDFEPHYPGEDVPENILDEALMGQGYHCGHYMIVQNAVMNAYGYVTRCLGAGPGVKGGPDGHHGINEVWSNEFGKWYLSDAKYNHHFEKDGVPLSALEVRDEFLKNKAADITLVKGPKRQSIAFDLVADKNGNMRQVTREQFAQTYTWIEWEKYNDRATNWPAARAASSILVMYEDEYFRNHIWIWDDRPHWAYSKPEHMVRVSDRSAIEWTPNTLASRVTIEGDVANIVLESMTPNLKSYQMKRGNEDQWHEVDDNITIEIHEQGEELTFRALNLAGVHGPEHRMIFKR